METPQTTPSGQNRKYKDSLFVDLFSNDITAKANFISLYNALAGSSLLVETTSVERQMLENVLYMTYYNDVAMLIDNRLVILAEHQSTINENMPLRFLDYAVRIYEKLTPMKAKFKKQLVKIPRPEFYVLYNGTADLPDHSVLRLSDAFIKDGSERKSAPLELTVDVYNINAGRNLTIQERCPVLREYSEFVALVREMQAKGTEDPFGDAIKAAIRQGILADYLERKATEVRNMILGEYDYDMDIAVQREEAEARGKTRGLAQSISQLMRNLKMTAEQAMDALSIQPDERAKYADLISR